MFVTHSHNLKGKRKTIYLTEKKIENEQQSRVFNQKKQQSRVSKGMKERQPFLKPLFKTNSYCTNHTVKFS